MCEAVMDTGEKRKPDWSLILPRKLEESRRYIWTSSQVTGRTALPGWSSHSPTWAHVQRTTAGSIAAAFLPSPSARCGACSGRAQNNSSAQVFPQPAHKQWFPAGFVVPKGQKRTGYMKSWSSDESKKPQGSHFLQNYAVVLQFRSSLHLQEKEN